MDKKGYNISARYIFFLVVIVGIFLYLIYGLANIQLRSADEYVAKAETKRTTKVTLRGSRGMITDSDAVILAKDEMIYNVTFYRDASQNSASQYKDFTRSIVEAIDIIEKNGNTLSISFVIRRNEESGEWEFNFGSAAKA